MSKPTSVISVRGRSRSELLALPDFVYVGRRCAGWPASIWGNPFKHGPDGVDVDFRRVSLGWYKDRAHLRCPVELYRLWVLAMPNLARRLPDLRGRVLGCWCGDWRPPMPEIGCHAVVLARMAEEAGVEAP